MEDPQIEEETHTDSKIIPEKELTFSRQESKIIGGLTEKEWKFKVQRYLEKKKKRQF